MDANDKSKKEINVMLRRKASRKDDVLCRPELIEAPMKSKGQRKTKKNWNRMGREENEKKVANKVCKIGVCR